MATKRKTTTAIVAGVTAAALLLGGTFAWTSISQTAKNETAGIVNVGGRLHDDFNGTNKDVYVENFTDPLNGGQPIYARIKLTEYMEVGQDAGGFGADVNNDGKTTAVPVIDGTDINDEDTWKVFIPGSITGDSITCEDCGDGTTTPTGACGIHNHWKWDVAGGTTFMPTFNKDKDSLAADINGTYAGTDETDKIYYDDYVEYITDNTADGVGIDILEADKESYDGKIYSIIGTEYYDDDPDTEDNGGTRQEANKTHTAKATGTATVITMAEWLQNPVPGNYWVYDEDGWAYWANPIMPGEATGLLLDSINMTKNPGEKCYYAINVVGQFATVGDWYYFDEDQDSKFDGTDNALTLLDTASKNVATVVVTNVSGATLLAPGSSYEFSANVYVNGVEQYAATDFEWSVLNADGSENTKSSIADGVLTVAENETAKNLVIVAKAKDANYLGALGMISVAVEIKDFKIAVLPQTYTGDDGSTYEEAWPGYMSDNSSWTMQLMVGDTPITEGVTWSSELIATYPTDNEFLEGTGIDATTGVFTVAEGEVTWQSGQYPSNAWHVVEVTASVEGEEPVKERFYLGAYFGVEGLKFYEAGTTNAVSEYSLVVGAEYDTRIRMWCQNTYTDIMTDYMNPISFEGATVTVTDREGNTTDKATWVDGKFIATEVGEYIVNLTKEDAIYGTISGQDYIEVVDETIESYSLEMTEVTSLFYNEYEILTTGDTAQLTLYGIRPDGIKKAITEGVTWSATVASNNFSPVISENGYLTLGKRTDYFDAMGGTTLTVSATIDDTTTTKEINFQSAAPITNFEIVNTDEQYYVGQSYSMHWSVTASVYIGHDEDGKAQYVACDVTDEFPTYSFELSKLEGMGSTQSYETTDQITITDEDGNLSFVVASAGTYKIEFISEVGSQNESITVVTQ